MGRKKQLKDGEKEHSKFPPRKTMEETMACRRREAGIDVGSILQRRSNGGRRARQRSTRLLFPFILHNRHRPPRAVIPDMRASA